MDKLLKRALSKRNQGDFATAIQLYRKILKRDPDHLDANYLLGTLYAERGELAHARRHLEAAAAAAPRSFGVVNNLGNVHRMLGDNTAAQACYERASTLDRAAAQPWKNLAAIHREAGRLEAAWDAYHEALRREPDSVATLSFLLLVSQTLCRWDGIDALEHRLDRLLTRPAATVEPLPRLATSDDAAHQLENARRWAAQIGARHAPDRPLHAAGPRTPGPLRIGYLSADLRDHVIGRIFAGIAAHHDRSRFEIHAYALGTTDDSAVEQAIRGSVARFHLLGPEPPHAIAGRIAADGIDLLVDLSGYTQGGRPEILCHRPAPLQVAYLGYPGSSGAPWIDAIIATDALIDPARERFYSERVARVDGPWFALEPERFERAEALTRESLGIPQEAFVFASFNQSYKIRPELFAVWTELLREVAGSVLLALVDSAAAEANLRRELAAAGIAPARLVAFPRGPLGRYLGAQRHADLLLDTYPYGAGATAAYALWSGLPIVTRAGDPLISRVAAGALRALGLDELITESSADYRALALALAREPKRLGALRERLLAARETAPLFDVAAQVRTLERCFEELVGSAQ